MTNKFYSGLFFIFFSGLVFATVLFYFADGIHAATPVPTQISSKTAREVRVYLKSQRFGYYERGELVFWGVVCSGKRGMETPKGKFQILMKARDYYSRKYDGAPMPYAMQFSTAGHFLHVGELRSVPSSHGCVRLGLEDASRLFYKLKLKDPVVVTD